MPDIGHAVMRAKVKFAVGADTLFINIYDVSAKAERKIKQCKGMKGPGKEFGFILTI